MEIITTPRGKLALKYKDQLYFKHLKRKSGLTIWRCHHYKTQCKAIVKTNLIGRLVSAIDSHNHSTKPGINVTESDFQSGSGFSKIRENPTSQDSRGDILTYQGDLHSETDQPGKDLRCTTGDIDYSSKTKVINIFRCLHRLTDRQKKQIKNLLCRFELSSGINCASNCELMLICKNKRYKSSNIYEIMCYSIYKICCEKNDTLSADDDYENNDGDRIVCNRKEENGSNRLKRNRDDDDSDDCDGVSYDDENDDDEDTEVEDESDDRDDDRNRERV